MAREYTRHTNFHMYTFVHLCECNARLNKMKKERKMKFDNLFTNYFSINLEYLKTERENLEFSMGKLNTNRKENSIRKIHNIALLLI